MTSSLTVAATWAVKASGLRPCAALAAGVAEGTGVVADAGAGAGWAAEGPNGTVARTVARTGATTAKRDKCMCLIL